MGTAVYQCVTDSCPLALSAKAFATLMLYKVQRTGVGLRGWGEGATIVLSFLATHPEKPIDRTKFCDQYWLMGFATHFAYMAQFDLIRIQSQYQIPIYIRMCICTYIPHGLCLHVSYYFYVHSAHWGRTASSWMLCGGHNGF